MSDDKKSNKEITGIDVYIMSLKKLEEYLKDKGSNLTIPIFQRPYVWEKKLVRNLFNDIYSNLDKKEYRLGTIILHNNEDNNRFEIVDGQQRLITLFLLLNILNDTSICLQFENGVDKVSIGNFQNNYEILTTMINAHFNNEKEKEKNKYLQYLKENCTFAVIITDKQEEAFQLFDSQNSRGKSLAPHDYLKAYHLREMRNMPESEQEKIINQWESIKEKELTELFADYLYPVVRWHKKRDAFDFTEKDIDTFKCISQKYKYKYALYHKRSVIFAEKIEKEFSDFLSNKECNMFQLTQPVISGEYFFKYVFYYDELLKEVKKKIAKHHDSKEVPEDRTGDIYTKLLYTCALLLFIDRFGIENIETYMETLYKWSYSLRLVMSAVQWRGINNYAKGENSNINNGALFNEIGEMNKPEDIMKIELKKIKLEVIESNNNSKYEKIRHKLQDIIIINKEG